MSEPLVTFQNVVKRFGVFTALESMNLDIHAGEFLAIMGSSGCGKTTTLRILAGLEVPTEGEVRLRGKRINELPTWQRDTPLVWQSLALFPFLTVVENVEFALRMRGVGRAERRRRAMDWLERMQIAELAVRNIAQLSGGQRQRVALARSLVIEPEILLLDEPLSALDAHLKVRMQSLLSGLQKDLGITFVYVTHSQSEAFSMADRVVIMSRGRIEQIGRPIDIYRSPRNRFVAEFLGSANIFVGRVAGLNGERVTFTTGQGQLDVAANADRDLGRDDEAVFVVSDDHIRLSDRPLGEGWNVLPARVIGEEFVGATATIHMEASNGLEMRAQKSHEELSGINTRPGAEIYASFRPADAYILPGE